MRLSSQITVIFLLDLTVSRNKFCFYERRGKAFFIIFECQDYSELKFLDSLLSVPIVSFRGMS